MSDDGKVIPLGGSAFDRCGRKVLQDIDSYFGGVRTPGQTEWLTVLGKAHALLDGTVLLRLDASAWRLVPSGPWRGERHVEMTAKQARELSEAFRRVAYLCERRRAVLDGTAGYQFRHDGERWWVRHERDEIALRVLHARSRRDPRFRDRRACASCRASLAGAIYVYDRTQPTKGITHGKPRWGGAEFCRACVEEQRQPDVGAPR